MSSECADDTNISRGDLAAFLLTRGPHAYLGHSWRGCSREYLFPPALNADYGEPTELCKETSAGSGVFERDWSKATVRLDCGSYAAKITMKATGRSAFDRGQPPKAERGAAVVEA